MAKTRIYQHYCPVARSLEVIGEKWSLLVVRDLLRGPQRFTDLLRYLGSITPKWLTLRLRDLEAAGIVERDSREGRREVWYRLTSKGRDLAPVVNALSIWGIEHEMRPPQPGEPVHPLQTMSAIASVLNRRGVRAPRPLRWCVRFGADRVWSIVFDADGWRVERGEGAASLTIETTPEAWTNFLLTAPEERRGLLATLRIEGEPEALDELIGTFGWARTPEPAPALA